jgi:hypothetical protein
VTTTKLKRLAASILFGGAVSSLSYWVVATWGAHGIAFLYVGIVSSAWAYFWIGCP